MKTHIRNLFLLPALIAVLNLLPAGRVTAQTFTTLHSFSGGSDGANPIAGLITNSSGNTLYGTAQFGGNSDNGTVFAVNTDGTGFTNLHSFTARDNAYATNSDGVHPFAGLALSGNTLYGTAASGGSSAYGTVFAVSTDGTVFTNLHNFTGGTYVFPLAGLVLSGSTLYGTTEGGNFGGVFAVNADGTGFTTLHGFAGPPDEGAYPLASLTLSGNRLFGTANYGGSAGNGTIFALNTDGLGFTNLYSFTAGSGTFPGVTNSDGASPRAGLILSGNTVYGTAFGGGSSGRGTVFAVNIDGTGFRTLHSFAALDPVTSTNNDGVNPWAGLVLLGNTLYGTASSGGSWGNGTVFAINTNGTQFRTLHSFTPTNGPSLANSDGASPQGGLILSGNTLYGTAQRGGSSGNGTVFSLSFRPQLTITFPGDRPVLSWPINDAGFSYTGYHLQYTRGTNSAAVWTDLVYAPIILNGQFSVTVPWTLFLGQSSSSFRLVQ